MTIVDQAEGLGHAPAELHHGAPLVSVIMATYNGRQFIEQSINSILSQTLPSFELIVADDCSTDDTRAILGAIKDPRVRIFHNSENMGVVRSRNRCMAMARGQYVAMLDHDDLSRPNRLAKQVAYLEEHPSTVLLGTAAHTLNNGILALTRHPPHTSPIMIRWLLHIANPLVCSSVMFPAAAVQKLDIFLREDLKYADDYDLYHRLMPYGDIARLDDPLTVYRLHASNTFRLHEDTMTGNAIKVLEPAYRRCFGDKAATAASLIVRHLSTGRPVQDNETLALLQNTFERLNAFFLANHDIGDADRTAIANYADVLWRRMLHATANSGSRIQGTKTLRYPSGRSLSKSDQAHLTLSKIPFRAPIKRQLRKLMKQPQAQPLAPAAGQLFGNLHERVKVDETAPPTLFVVVDTEAEFDWNQPFARNLTNVTAIDDIERGQAVFDKYGLRPIYVLDYPIASQDRSINRLRAMLDRDACYIGAHLHPWTTPPFDEEVSDRNSFPGNLPAALEEQKLVRLLDVIRDRFGVSAKFYKAGRYGFGPATAEILARHGIMVDLSVRPETNLTGIDGPNFEDMESVPYWAAGGKLLMMPMTRASVGSMPSVGRWCDKAQRLPGLSWLSTQPLLSRLRVSDKISLSPEGMTAAEQIRLIKFLLRGGHRQFVLNYHSPSLSSGHTPYVRTAGDVDRFVKRIEVVTRFFLENIGGLPGYPPDLLNLAAARHQSARSERDCATPVSHPMDNLAPNICVGSRAPSSVHASRHLASGG